jgi:tetratricopeptide (TPR) repeat protein
MNLLVFVWELQNSTIAYLYTLLRMQRLAKRLKRLCRIAVCMDWLYPNIASPAQRVRGRAYWSMGKKRKARRCYRKAVRSAESFGADYDRARSLLDLAASGVDNHQDLRAQAIELLKKQESVIPFAERWLLGDQYDPAVVAPPPDGEICTEDQQMEQMPR